MSRITKADKAEALESLKREVACCGPDGNATLLIIDDGGKPSGSGRTHKLQLRVMQPSMTSAPEGRLPNASDRPQLVSWLNLIVARALGYRVTKDDSITMGGYGYSRPQDIAAHIASAVGHAVFVQSEGAGMGDIRGWVKP